MGHAMEAASQAPAAEFDAGETAGQILTSYEPEAGNFYPDTAAQQAKVARVVASLDILRRAELEKSSLAPLGGREPTRGW